jgi:hypothetical protein
VVWKSARQVVALEVPEHYRAIALMTRE